MWRLCVLVPTAASSAAWPDGVLEACGITQGSETVFDRNGALTLEVAQLCSSFACRSAINNALPATGDRATAFSNDLRNCAAPTGDFAGAYTLVEFTASALPMAQSELFDSWGKLALSTAILSLHLDQSNDQAAAMFQQTTSRLRRLESSTIVMNSMVSPTGSDIGFQYTIAGTLLPLSDTTSLREKLATSLTASAGSAVTVPTAKVHELTADPQYWYNILVSQWWFWTFIVCLSVYLVLAAVTLAGYGPPWFKDAFLCWPEVCVGKGCIPYRILCCPLVLSCNAIRIYGGTCLYTYCMTMLKCAFCKGVCWSDFEDPEFPPAAWQASTQGDTASGGQGAGQVSSRRASEICGGDGGAQLFSGDIEPSDMMQGAIGDCWLIAGLSCVAERPEILQSAIQTKRVTPHGKYRFRLWNTIKGQPGTEWRNIVIDDLIPVNDRGEPMFAKSNHNELWAMLMEKAFAKLYGGYKNLEGGQMWWPIAAITGNDPVCFHKQGQKWQATGADGVYTPGEDEVDHEQLFRILKKLDRNGAFLCVSSVTGGDQQGLIDGHAYTMLRCVSVGTSYSSSEIFRLVQLRNPWGRNEWTGSWSDKSDMWKKYPYVAQKLNQVDREDGSFWMQWEDFCTLWENVQVVDCNTDIHTMGTPVYDEHLALGPIWSCLKGCFSYWCCCVGFFRLYFSRRRATNLEELQKDLDKDCGIDQSGVYCDGGRKAPVSQEKYGDLSDAESGAE